MKKISEFLCENFQFLVVKFSIYLNRRVFIMTVEVEGPYPVCVCWGVGGGYSEFCLLHRLRLQLFWGI